MTADSLVFSAAAIGVNFKGRFNSSKTEIAGIWKQKASIPLTLKKVNGLMAIVRPQTPKPPFPYVSEDVEYDNPAKTIHYGATLTYPHTGGKYPAVILISGSGQEDRDETVFDHKPFAVLADYLTRRGIAVLRVDDRGVGKSTGEVLHATSVNFTGDVLTSLHYLKSLPGIDKTQIGLIGHSEGGMIAPLVAISSPDVAFIVSMAGVGVRGLELANRQTADALAASGLPAEQVTALNELYGALNQAARSTPAVRPVDGQAVLEKWRAEQSPKILNELKLNKGQQGEEGIKSYAYRINLDWMRYFINYDPGPVLSKVKIPVLAINGSKDIQVSAVENLAGFERYLKAAGNKDFKTLLIPGLNHLFQTADKGTVGEYEKIDETISPVALGIIGDWIDRHVKK